MTDVTPITKEERETARKHFMPGVMREHGGIMRNGSVMQAYEARLTELEAALKEAGEVLGSAAAAAFHAGRRAGHLDAIRIVVEIMDEKTTLTERQPFMEACDAIQRFAPDCLDGVK